MRLAKKITTNKRNKSHAHGNEIKLKAIIDGREGWNKLNLYKWSRHGIRVCVL